MSATPRSYLDHNATSPVRPAVAEAMARALRDLPGNPSSIHAEGRAARAAVERARAAVARLVGARPESVVFTGGGTEACNAVLAPGTRRRGAPPSAGDPALLLGATEHPCCLDGHRFPTGAAESLPVGSDGLLDLDHLRARLAALAGAPVLVSVGAANAETGVLQPLAEIARVVAAHPDAVLHADAVQAAGRVPLDLRALGLDALSLSAHKLGGPKGVGALVLTERVEGDRLLKGGGQERGLRAGTENVAGLVGFGVAAEIAAGGLEAEAARLAGLRDGLLVRMRAAAPDLVVFGEAAPRLPNTLAFAVPGLAAETALIAFDLDGIALSSGAACASGKVARSPVLAAMGVAPDLAACALRASLGWSTTPADVARFAAAFERRVASLYERRNAA